MDESFGLAIQEHLELQRQNRALEEQMPLARYREQNANGNGHAPAARVELEDTQEWSIGADGPLLPSAEDLWTGTPAFEWGD